MIQAMIQTQSLWLLKKKQVFEVISVIITIHENSYYNLSKDRFKVLSIPMMKFHIQMI